MHPVGSGVDPSGTSLWVPMEFWGCRSEALRGCRGDWTCLRADGVARRLLVGEAFPLHKAHKHLLAGQCIHVLKHPQGAALSAQNGVFFDLLPTRNRALEKGRFKGLWHSTNPTSAEHPHRVQK